MGEAAGGEERRQHRGEGPTGRAEGRPWGGWGRSTGRGACLGFGVGPVHGRACRGREEGEARSAVLYWGSLTVPRAEAAGTRGRGVPGDGAWHWDVRAPDTVSTPPTGSARALSSGASHPAPSPWVELGSTQGVVWCGVVWCGVVWCGVVCRRRCYQRAKGRDVYPRVKVNGLGCVCCVRAVRKCVGLGRGRGSRGDLVSSPLATALLPGAPAAPLPFLLAGAGAAPATPTPSCCPGPGGPSAVWHAPWRGRTRSVWTPPRRGGGTPCPCGVVWCGVVWCGVVWCGVVWCGVVWCRLVWCGVVWCRLVWCGVVWCRLVSCVCAVVLFPHFLETYSILPFTNIPPRQSNRRCCFRQMSVKWTSGLRRPN